MPLHVRFSDSIINIETWLTPIIAMSGSQGQASPMDQFTGFFQDASMVNLDFMDNPGWNLGVGGNSLI